MGSEIADRLPTGLVSFLLTDVEGSTVMWDGDPVNTALAIERHDALVGEMVAAHGGTLLKNKGEGDSTLSVFHTAPDAVAAANAVMRALDAEAWPGALQVRVRAAVHTGEAYERDGDYFGPTLNRAARVRSLARGGQILLTRAAAELVLNELPEDCSLVDQGRYELRGISSIERVFELVTAQRAVPVITAVGELPSALQATSAFVGRTDELARLEHAWGRVQRGERRVVLLAGEPGIGKTRLTAELARRARRDGVVLFGRCEEGLSAPYQPFIEGIAAWLASVDDATLGAVAPSVLSDAARLWPAIAARVAGLPLPPSRDVDQDRYAAFQATVELLQVASHDRPLVFVLDDLQWATAPTVLLLRHVMNADADVRVLFVGTFRDSEIDAAHPLTGALADFRRNQTADVIGLQGLAPDDVHELVALSAGAPDAALSERLARETAGNPFFVAEMLASPGLPAGVRDVVAHRLGRLPESVQRVLAVAAVLGPEFDHVDLARCVLPDEGDDVIEAIERAVAADVLVERGPRHAFKHALVRDCVLDGLSALRLRSLHRRIGDAIAAASDADSRSAELATHFAAADDQPARAARYAFVTAMRSLQLGAVEDARASLELMREQLGRVDGEMELRVDLDLADAYLIRASNVDGGKDVGLRAVRSALAIGDFDRAAEAALLVVEAMGFSTSDEEVVAVLSNVAGAATGTAAHPQLVGALAQAVERGGDHVRARTLSAQAVELARGSGSDEALFMALYASWVTALCDGTIAERRAYSDEMRTIAERTRADQLYNTARLFQGIDGIESGDRAAFETASEELWQNREASSKWMHDMTVRSHPWRQAFLALLDGRWDDAAANSDQMLGEAEADPHPDLYAAYAGQVLQRGRELGQHEQFLPLIEAAIVETPDVLAYRAGHAMLLAELGRTDDARAVLDDIVGAGIAAMRRDQESGATFAMLADVVATLGDAALATDLIAVLNTFSGRLIKIHSAVCVLGAGDRYLAMLAHVVGDDATAGAAFERAIALEESVGSRPLATRSRLWYARYLRDIGDAEGARDVARVGLATAEELTMALVVEQFAALL